MPEPRFQAGDVVRLKSGGPPITVMGIVRDDGGSGGGSRVECRWFEQNEYGYWTLRIEAFPIEALVRVGGDGE